MNHRLSYLLALLLVPIAANAQSIERSWKSVLQQLPDSDRGPLPFIRSMECGIRTPDSVTLRSKPDRYTSIMVWQPGGAWKERMTPLATDTISVRVVAAVCSRKDSVLTYLVLQRDNAFVALLPAGISNNDSWKSNPVEQDVAFVRQGANVSELVSVTTAGKLKRFASASVLHDSLSAWRSRAGAARRQALERRGWSKVNIERILAGDVAIGMTDKMVLEALGEPKRSNRTTTAEGVREQWVYGDHFYLYFSNGVLVTIQDSR